MVNGDIVAGVSTPYGSSTCFGCRPGYVYGKRSADAEPEAEATADASADPSADPWYGYYGYGGWHRPYYGYGYYGYRPYGYGYWGR